MYYNNQPDFSATHESAFIKNFSPSNPPPIQITLHVHPELSARYGFIAGLLAQEIETKRNISPPRMYFFNKMARDGFMNNDFKELVVSCIKVAIYLHFGQKHTNWNEIVETAVNNTLNMVLAALTLQSNGLRSQYQIPANHIPELENAYNIFAQIDNQANIIIESLQRQAQGISTYGNNNTGIHSVHSNMHPGMMSGGNQPMMNQQEPTINVPGLGTMPLSEYNLLKSRLSGGQQQQQTGMGHQGFMGSHSNPAVTASSITSMVSGMGGSGGALTGSESISDAVRATLVPDTGVNAVNTAPQHLIDNGIAQSMSIFQDTHESETTFGPAKTIAGTATPAPAPTPVSETKERVLATASSIKGVTTITDGVEYYRGKEVYRIEGYFETFFIDFDGSIPIRPSEHFIAIPACIDSTHKRVYQIYNDGTFRSVDLFDLTDEEKLEYRKKIDMDIKRHEILMSEKQREARMNLIARTLDKPPASVIRTTEPREVLVPSTVVEEGEDKQLIDVERIDKIIEERQNIVVPEFSHVVQDALDDIGELETISEKYLLEYAVEQPDNPTPDVFTVVTNQYHSLFDVTHEGVLNDFVKRLSNCPTLKAVSEAFAGAYSDIKEQEQSHLMRSLNRLEKIFVDAINLRLRGQMGLDVTVTEWHACYDELLGGLDKHFGVITAQVFLRDERNFIRSIITKVQEHTLKQLYGNLKTKTATAEYTEKDLVFVGQKVTYTTIPVPEEDLQLDFTRNASGVLSLDESCHVVLYALAKRIIQDTTGTGRRSLINYIVTTDNVKFMVSEGLFDVSGVNIQKVS